MFVIVKVLDGARWIKPRVEEQALGLEVSEKWRRSKWRKSL